MQLSAPCFLFTLQHNFAFHVFYVMLNNKTTLNIWRLMEKSTPCFALKHHIFMESWKLEIVKAFLGHWSHPHADAGLTLFSFPVKAACDMVVQRNLHFNRTHFHKSSAWFCLCLWSRYIQCYTGHMKLQQEVVNDVGNEKFVTKSKEAASWAALYVLILNSDIARQENGAQKVSSKYKPYRIKLRKIKRLIKKKKKNF